MAQVGTAWVPVVPKLATGWAKGLSGEMASALAVAGKTSGESGGKAAGGAYASSLTAAVKRAASALPDVKIKTDTSDASKAMARIRTELEALGRSNVGVDISTTDAAAKVAQLRKRLDDLSHGDAEVAVKVDANAARASLGAFEAAVDKSTTAAGETGGKRFSSKFAGHFKSIESSLGGMLKRGLSMGSLAGAGGAAMLGKAAVEAASDIQQSTGAVEAVFKGEAARIKSASQTAAGTLGLSAAEYQNMAATLGSTLKNKGIKDFTSQTDILIKKGADLSAQFGGSTKEAVEALGSALRGETDPIERYGISMQEADIKAKAAELGLVKSQVSQDKLTAARNRAIIAERNHSEAVKKYGAGSEQALKTEGSLASARATLNKVTEGSIPNLTNAQKATAALAIIQEQSKDATGAAAREHDTYASRMQQAKAAATNLAASVGTSLLPYVTRLAGYLTDTVLPALRTFGKNMRDGKGDAGRLGAALKSAGEHVLSLGKFLVAHKGSALAFVGGLLALRTTVGAILAVRSAFNATKTAVNSVRTGVGLMKTGLNNLKGSGALGKIAADFRLAGTQAKAAATSVGKFVAEKAKAAASATVSGVKALGSAIASAGKAAASAAVDFGKFVAAKAKTAAAATVAGLKALGSAIASAGKAAASAAVDLGKFVAAKGRAAAGAAVSGIKSAASALVSVGKSAATAAVSLGRVAATYTAMAIRAGVYAAAQAAVRAGTLLYTAAQWALNVALNANPIGLIVVGLAALGAALYLAWTKSETFRRIVTAAWNGIKAAASATVTWIRNTAWPWMRNAFQQIGDKASWLWRSAIRPAFDNVMGKVRTVTAFIKNSAWPWVRSAFQSIGDKATWVWRNAISPAFNNISRGVHALIGAFNTAKDGIGRAWSGIIDKVRGPIGTVLNFIQSNFVDKINGFLSNKVLTGMGVNLKIPNIVGRASGGRAPTPTMFNGVSSSGKMAVPFKKFAHGGRPHSGKIPGPIPRDWVDNTWGVVGGKTPVQLAGGEMVLSNPATRDIDKHAPGFLDRLNREGAKALFAPDAHSHGGVVRGYAMGGKVSGLNGPFRAALDKFADATHGRYSVISGLRTRREQEILYAKYLNGTGNLAAKPGTSRHESGNAADLSPSNARDVDGALAARMGLTFPVPGESWHIELAGGRSGAGGGGGGGFLSGVFDVVGKIVNPMKEKILGLLNRGGSGLYWDTAKGVAKTVLNAAVKKVTDFTSGAGAVGAPTANPPGSGVQRWAPVAQQAMAMAGLPASYLPLLLHRMNVESGGNPNAINNWDVNAKNGVPSQGLMQVIPPTFAAYAGPLRSRGLRDPLANIYAAIKYTLSRYGVGGIGKAWGGTMGYATGTTSAAAGVHLVGERGPELVDFGSGGARVWNANDTGRMINGEMPDINATVHVYVGDREITDIVRTEVDYQMDYMRS